MKILLFLMIMILMALSVAHTEDVTVYDEERNLKYRVQEDGKIYDKNWNRLGTYKNDRVYNKNWNQHYKIEDSRIYDSNWNLKGRITGDKIYDKNWNLQGRIKR